MKKHKSWSERLKWAEEQGLKNLQEKFTTADTMSKEAQTTLTYVLAGMGGTFAYILNGLEKAANPLLAGAILLCFYFFILGVYLAWKAFFISDYPSPFQEAKNLLEDPSLPFDEVREGEILNLTDRLEKSQVWITNKVKAINRVRLFLVLSPIAFLVGFALFKCFS